MNTSGASSSAVWPPVLFGVAFLVAWELAVEVFDWKPYFLPAPSVIWEAFVDNIDIVREAAIVSGRNALVGLLVGTVLGVAMSFLLMRFRLLNDMVSPLAVALNAIPIIVLVSVFNNQFASTSEVPRRLMVTLVVYFVVLVNVAKGLRQVEPTHLELLRSYAASPFDVLRKARVPNAVPYLFTALKIAAPLAVITAFVAEYFGGPQNGLGLAHHRERQRLAGGDVGLRARGDAARPGVLPGLHRPGEPHHTTQGREPQGRKHMKHKQAVGRRRGCARARRGPGHDSAVPAPAPPNRRSRTRRRRVRVGRRRSRCSCNGSIQAQFAGYFAADDKGFYERLLPRRRDPRGRRRHRAAAGARRRRGRLRHRLGAQGAGRRGRRAPTSSTSPRSSSAPARCRCRSPTPGSPVPEDFAGKNIGNWGFGNEYEIFAALAQAGLDPASDVTLVQQQFDMVGLLDGDIDAAEAMTYNEYAQVLEAENPDTGELYQPEDLNVISYEEVGVGMLQDAIWADGGRLADDPAYATSPPASSPRRSRAGRSAGTTPRSAATSSSPPARSSATATSCGR